MKFSLILATVGRTEELKRFLESLEVQHGSVFELIAVDQNPDGRLAPLLESFAIRFPLKHFRSERGLSRARNVGLQHITGDIVAFPDDDCWYPPGLLSYVAHFFSIRPECDAVVGWPARAAGIPSPGWERRPGLLTKSSVWSRGISFTIFMRCQVITAVGSFDETLGVGSDRGWGSGEESDYLVSALAKGFCIQYDPDIQVCHPTSIERYDRGNRAKARLYGAGMGRVLRKHGYSRFEAWKHILLPLRGVVYSLATARPKRALHRWAVFRGRLAGYLAKLP